LAAVFTAVLEVAVFEVAVLEVFPEALANGAASFCVPVLADVLAFAFDVEVTVDAVVVVGGSGFATTSSTTAETCTRLASLTIAIVLGGSGAILSAVTGVFTVTCSIVSASTPTARRTVVEEVAVFVWLETTIRSGTVGTVGAMVLAGCVAGSVEGTPELGAGAAVVTLFVDGVLPAPNDVMVTDPMVFTVDVIVGVVVGVIVVEDRRGLELVVVGLVTFGGVDAITKEVTSGPACVVGAEERRERT
jgi:hypothetical protein